MRTVLAVVALLVIGVACQAQEVAGKLEALKATPEQVAPLKAVLDDLWTKAQKQDAAGVIGLLHEKSAFWQLDGTNPAKAIHRDELAEMLTTDPMPEEVTLGEAKAWLGDEVALVGAPLEGIPEGLLGDAQPAFGAVLVKVAEAWQVVTADLYDLTLEAPAFEAEEAEDVERAETAFQEFQQELLARGAPFLIEALEDEGVVAAWSDTDYRLLVLQPKELGGMLAEVAQVSVAPTAEPEEFAVYGTGVAVLAANVNVNISAMGMTLERRLILCLGYQPETAKWRMYGVAAVPLPK